TDWSSRLDRSLAPRAGSCTVPGVALPMGAGHLLQSPEIVAGGGGRSTPIQEEPMAEFEPVDGFRWLKLRQPGGVYYIVRSIDNEKRRTSLETTDFEEAKVKYRERLGTPLEADRAARVSDAWKVFIENPWGTMK